MAPTALQQRIVERIEETGQVSFAEYMRMALYEPDYGYYVTGPARMGWEGDYYTSTDVAVFFANCVGRQLQQMWMHLDQPHPFNVLEQGAGRGQLAQGVQQWAAREDASFAAALTYQIEDMRHGLDALQSTQSPSVIISNELVDALPVHIVAKHEGQLYEIYIDSQDGRLYEVLGEPSSEEVANYLDDYKIPWRTFADGWRGEVGLAAIAWMQHASQLIAGTSARRKRRGFILTIDYGDKARALYTPERRHGTLACYFQHQLSERPLARPGEQDITAHVNFTALLNTGRRAGLRLHTFTTQREWLSQLGIHEELERIRSRDFAIIETEHASNEGQKALFQWYNLRQRVAALTAPTGMGNFKVLILKR